MTVTFTKDGAYTLDVAGSDALGNTADVTYEGEAVRAFTVDRTPPRIEVVWDNTDVRNGKYYNRSPLMKGGSKYCPSRDNSISPRRKTRKTGAAETLMR